MYYVLSVIVCMNTDIIYIYDISIHTNDGIKIHKR